MNVRMTLFASLNQRWPSLTFLTWGLLFGWLDVKTMSFTLFTSKYASSLTSVAHDAFVFWLPLAELTCWLFMALFYKLSEYSFKSRATHYVVAAFLAISVILSRLLDTGFAAPGLLALDVGLTAFGITWASLRYLDVLRSLETKEILINIALAKVVAAIYFFVVTAVPVECRIAILVLTPVIVAYALANVIGLPYSFKMKDLLLSKSHPADAADAEALYSSGKFMNFFSADYALHNESALSRATLVRLGVASFVAFFATGLTRSAPIVAAEQVDAAITYSLIEFVSLVLCFLFAWLVIAFPEQKQTLVPKVFFSILIVSIVLFVTMPLFSGAASIVLSWVSGGVRVLLDAMFTAFICIAIRSTGASTAQIGGYLFFARALGGFLGRLLMTSGVLGSIFGSGITISVIDVVVGIVLYMMFSSEQIARLVRFETDEPLDKPQDKEQDQDTVLNSFAECIGLSPREQDVFNLLMKGYTIRLTAERLNLAQSTVKAHIGKVYLKAGVTNREELLIALSDYSQKHS